MFEHVGLDGLSVHRRLLEHAHIAQTAHRHIQCTGDWRSRECEHVHVFDELLEALLLLNTEALFLVDDRKPKVAELDVLLNEPVCADDHIDLAALQPLEDFLLLLCGAEAREQLYADRIAFKALANSLIVLPRQNGGGAEEGALLAVRHALECRAQGDLGFSEAHVAAEQSVHRRGALHIALDLARAGELIGRFLIFKLGFKVALPFVVAREGVAFSFHSG